MKLYFAEGNKEVLPDNGLTFQILPHFFLLSSSTSPPLVLGPKHCNLWSSSEENSVMVTVLKAPARHPASLKLEQYASNGPALAS